MITDAEWRQAQADIAEVRQAMRRMPLRQHPTLPTGAGLLGIIQIAGPNNEADFSDHRYWVKQADVSNTEGFWKKAMTLTGRPNAVTVMATNIAEALTRGHCVWPGQYIQFFSAIDQSTPKLVRHWFQFSPQQPFMWAKVTGATVRQQPAGTALPNQWEYTAIRQAIDGERPMAYNGGSCWGSSRPNAGAERTRVDPRNLTQGNACEGKQPSARPRCVARAFLVSWSPDPSRKGALP